MPAPRPDADALFELLVDEIESGRELMRMGQYSAAALCFLAASRHAHDLAKRLGREHRELEYGDE